MRFLPSREAKKKGQQFPLPPEHLDVADALVAIDPRLLNAWAQGFARTLARKVRGRGQPLTPFEMGEAKKIIKGEYSRSGQSKGRRSRPGVTPFFAE